MTISTQSDALKYLFFSRTVIDWNHLNRDIILVLSVHSFNESLENHHH